MNRVMSRMTQLKVLPIQYPIPNTQYFHNGVQFFPREESMDSMEEVESEEDQETESKETEIKETKEAETEIKETKEAETEIEEFMATHPRQHTYPVSGDIYLMVNVYKEKILTHIRHCSTKPGSTDLVPTAKGLAFNNEAWAAFEEYWSIIKSKISNCRKPGATVSTVTLGESKYSAKIEKRQKPNKVVLTLSREFDDKQISLAASDFAKIIQSQHSVRWSITKLKQSQLEEQLRKQQAELLELEAQATEADSKNVDLPDQEDIKKAYEADLKKKQAVEQSQFVDKVLYETDEEPEIINSCTEEEKEEQEEKPPTKKKSRIIPLQPSIPRKGKRYKPSNPVLKPKFCFFDVEMMQNKLSDVTDQKGREFFQHEVNLLICLFCCDLCKDADRESICIDCGKKLHVFSGLKATFDFCEFLFRNFAFKNVTAISHYGQAFDVQFILQYIIEKKETPKVILRGNKIMFLEYLGIRFVDSFNFLPMPLAQLSAAFGITELKKGYFPHFFNTSENQNYVGLFPDSKFFDPDGMKPGPRAAFMKWYDEQKAKQYDFQLEIQTYCTSDVLLLAAATLKFWDLFLQVSDNQIDPLVNAFTFASACNQLFRLRYLNDSELTLIPESGLFPARRFSNICCKWLEWEMKLYGVHIKHARNGGEVKVLDNFVDEFSDGSNSASIKYHGCAFHGCPRCFTTRRYSQTIPYGNLTLEEAYQKTRHQTRVLQKNRYVVVEKYGLMTSILTFLMAGLAKELLPPIKLVKSGLCISCKPLFNKSTADWIFEQLE
uniref:DNA-directed DNA polymerase n=1 Tax=Strigamia maritima TaxID=126957 RepID=T1J0X1_STRMM